VPNQQEGRCAERVTIDLIGADGVTLIKATKCRQATVAVGLLRFRSNLRLSGRASARVFEVTKPKAAIVYPIYGLRVGRMAHCVLAMAFSIVFI
jgi:hypothetical protein